VFAGAFIISFANVKNAFASGLEGWPVAIGVRFTIDLRIACDKGIIPA
jgi:hypothetical protein